MSVPGQCQNFCVILSLSLIQSDRSSSLARALKPSLLFYLHLSFTRIYLVTNINCRPAGTRVHSGDKHACARHGQPLTHSAKACAGGQTCEETPLKGAPEGNLSWVGEERRGKKGQRHLNVDTNQVSKITVINTYLQNFCPQTHS